MQSTTHVLDCNYQILLWVVTICGKLVVQIKNKLGK